MISVCIPTYNGEKYIKQQLQSILSQIEDDDEVIISDDSSSDKTVEIIKSFDDQRIKILENNKFHSPIFNLENALNHSKGEYIFLADQDDVWYEDKVKVMMSYLKEYDCVVHDAAVVDADMKEIAHSLFVLNKSREGYLHNLIKNGFTGCCMAFNRKILQISLPFPKNIPMHDVWIGLISEKFGKVLFLKQSLVYYRRHGSNASATAEKSKNSICKKLKFRVDLLGNLRKRKQLYGNC